jgi:hydrogenase nickel incorporation protein HypA/HybF
MHEGAIAQNIIEALEDQIQQGRISGRVQTIHLRVGQMMAIVPENLRFMFGILSKDTSLEGASIEIEDIPVSALCRECGADFGITEVCFFCPECHSRDIDIRSGRELLIDAVEVV